MEPGYARSCDGEPVNAMYVGYQHDSGKYCLAVANTEWGRIPGKARKGNCWVPYGGNEHECDDFDYVTHPDSLTTVPSTGYGPPPGARPIGYQNDGAGDLYAAIANTEWGQIPGKACNNTCWYPYDGQEHVTEDFEYLCCTRSDRDTMDVDLVKQKNAPENALKFGFQNDGAGDQFIAVAHTKWGKIPCKANAHGKGWYCYGGLEYETNNFHYVVFTSPHRSVKNHNCGPPEGAMITGSQTDERGDQYAVIALSKWGRIPGKACDDTCWYPYGGKEHVTKDFEYVVLN